MHLKNNFVYITHGSKDGDVFLVALRKERKHRLINYLITIA